MDDDEPIYRYYYKLVNDNIVYPIKKPLLYHPVIETRNFMINSYYLDRRFNISAPGQTTLEKDDKATGGWDRLWTMVLRIA